MWYGLTYKSIVYKIRLLLMIDSSLESIEWNRYVNYFQGKVWGWQRDAKSSQMINDLVWRKKNLRGHNS